MAVMMMMTPKSYGYKRKGEEGVPQQSAASCLCSIIWSGLGCFFRTIMAAMIYSDDRDMYMIIIMILSSDDDDDTAKS